VVPAERGIAGAGPGATWFPVVPDHHVVAHPTSRIETVTPTLQAASHDHAIS